MRRRRSLLVRMALRCYPERWRDQHSDEAAAVAEDLITGGDHAGSVATSYLAGAARARWRGPSSRLSDGSLHIRSPRGFVYFCAMAQLVAGGGFLLVAASMYHQSRLAQGLVILTGLGLLGIVAALVNTGAHVLRCRWQDSVSLPDRVALVAATIGCLGLALAGGFVAAGASAEFYLLRPEKRGLSVTSPPGPTCFREPMRARSSSHRPRVPPWHPPLMLAERGRGRPMRTRISQAVVSSGDRPVGGPVPRG